MLDVAPDPDFAKNKTIYWSFSEKQPGTEVNLMAVAKGQLSADETSVQNPTVIFRATPALRSNAHYGSRLLFDKSVAPYLLFAEWRHRSCCRYIPNHR